MAVRTLGGMPRGLMLELKSITSPGLISQRRAASYTLPPCKAVSLSILFEDSLTKMLLIRLVVNPLANLTQHAFPACCLFERRVDPNQPLQFAPSALVQLSLFTIPQQHDAPFKLLPVLRQSRRQREHIGLARFIDH